MNRLPDISMTLPLPPSTNRTERSAVVGGKSIRYSSREYKDWTAFAGYSAISQAHGDRIEYRYHMRVVLPEGRGDADNKVKPLQDMLQKCGVIANDKHLRRLVLEVDPARQKDMILVELWSTDDLPPSSKRTIRTPKNPVRKSK